MARGMTERKGKQVKKTTTKKTKSKKQNKKEKRKSKTKQNTPLIKRYNMLEKLLIFFIKVS